MGVLTNTFYIKQPCAQQKPEIPAFFHRECGRLIHAAVVNRGFRERLLQNPIKSIDAGYCGEKFYFSQDEKERIRSIRANTLEEFASKLVTAIDHPAITKEPCLREG